MAKRVRNRLLILFLFTLSVLGAVLISWTALKASSSLPAFQSARIQSEHTFSLNSPAGTYEPELLYTSDILPTDFAYDAVAARWNEDLPAQTSFELQLKGDTDSAWQTFTLDEDDPAHRSSELLFLKKPSNTLQYRVHLKSFDSKVSPLIKDLELYYFRTQQASSIQSANIWEALQADAKSSSDLHIISRAEWGADESIRVYNESNPPAQITEERDSEDSEKFANELVITKTIAQNQAGEDLTWPLQYPPKVREIIIHHTATKTFPKTLAESMATVRDIYYWHTLVKGWGDIGYNYLIDPMGNIFEGRFGGDGVIGGHAAGSNTGSIGISFIGNYSSCEQLYALESEEYAKCKAGDPEFAAHELSTEAEQAAINLIAYKAARFKINPASKGTWRGQLLPKIVGHLQVGKTRCPGDNIVSKLPEIREQAAAKYFEILPNLSASDLAYSYNYSAPEIPLYAAAAEGIPKRLQATAGKTVILSLAYKNTGRMEWTKGSYLKPLHDFEAIQQLSFEREQLDKMVGPGELAIFQVQLEIAANASGSYSLSFIPFLNLKQELKEARINLMLQVSPVSSVPEATDELSTGGPEADPGFLDTVANVLTTSKANTELGANPLVRVLISKLTDSEASLTSSAAFQLSTGSENETEIPAGSSIQVSLSNPGLKVSYNGKTSETLAPVRLTGTTITVSNLEAHPAWNPSLNDNTFRQTLELRNSNGKLLLINELPLEDYLKGVAEVPTGEPLEKMKTMSVIARGYAYQYLSTANRKFPGAPYDASDDPNVFQKYLGYNFELRSPDWLSAVAATTGQMLTYEGRVVKTPYFNESDGRTRSAKEVWGWDNTPWLQAVPDPLCIGGTLKGHGVGLSGCGAREAAKRGKLYTEILNYYYQGLTLSKLY